MYFVSHPHQTVFILITSDLMIRLVRSVCDRHDFLKYWQQCEQIEATMWRNIGRQFLTFWQPWKPNADSQILAKKCRAKCFPQLTYLIFLWQKKILNFFQQMISIWQDLIPNKLCYWDVLCELLIFLAKSTQYTECHQDMRFSGFQN